MNKNYMKHSFLKKLLALALVFSFVAGITPLMPLTKAYATPIYHNVSSGEIVVEPEDDTYILTGTNTTYAGTGSLITVKSGFTGKIVLQDVNIGAYGINQQAFNIEPGADVTLVLAGENKIQSSPYRAGIRVPGRAKLTIEGTGTLDVRGGSSGVGIGGNSGANWHAAGVSGGRNGEGSGIVIIKNGTINAYGSNNAPAIGGGIGGTGQSGNHIYGGAGDHGGSGGSNGTLIITNGNINLYGTSSTVGGGRGGYGGHGYIVKGKGGSGAPGGYGGSNGNIIMLGGKVSGASITSPIGGNHGSTTVDNVLTASPNRGKSGYPGNVFALVDGTISMSGYTLTEHTIRTDDYQAGIEVFADFTLNPDIAKALEDVGYDSKKTSVGRISGNNTEPSAFIQRNFISNADKAYITTFFTDSTSMNGNLPYIPEVHTGVMLNKKSDIILKTGIEQTHILIYDGNGNTGGVVELPAIKVKNAEFTIANVLDRVGYTWDEWNSKADGSGDRYVARETIPYPFEGTTTLYAKWIPNPYRLRFDLNGGTGTVPAETFYIYDTDVALPMGSDIRIDNYVITGWNSKADGTGESYSLGGTYKMGLASVLYAEWAFAYGDYSVKFETFGGSKVAKITNIASGSLINEVTPTKEGYTFKGWYKEPELTNKWDFTTDTVTSHITLYAKWEENGSSVGNKYNVNFEANGGTGAVNVNNVAEGSLISEQIPTKAGFNFKGWYKDIALSNKWNFATDTVTSNITLYAKWETSTGTDFSVNFETSGGTGVVNLTNIANGSLISEQIPTKAGFDFKGWYKDIALSNKWDFATDTVTSNITLYAKWEANSGNQFNVNFEANGGTGAVNLSNIANGALISEQIPTKAGFNFKGWYKDICLATKWNFATDTVTSNITLYAKWEAESSNMFTVNFVTNGGTAVSNLEVSAGGKITAPTTDKLGHKLTYWYKDSSLTNKWDFNVDEVTANTTLYADWKLLNYRVSYNANGGTGSVESISYPYNSTAYASDKNDLEKSGFTFAGWSTAKNGNVTYVPGDTFVMGAKHITLYAVWQPAGSERNVQFDSNGGSSVLGLNGVSYNSLISEPAQPTKNGYTFDGWYKNSQLSEKWNFGSDKVTASITLYAKWNAESYTIRYNANGGTGNVANVNGVPCGSTVIIKDKGNLAKEGFDFAGWGLTRTGEVKYTPDETMEMGSSEIILFAIWVPSAITSEKYTVRFDSNGGTSVSDLNDISKNDVISSKETTKTGHTFTGWYTDSSLTTLWDFDCDEVTEDMTLYAGWDVNTYLIKYMANGGTGGVSNAKVEFGKTVAVKTQGNLQKSGSTFIGWGLSRTGGVDYTSGETIQMGDSDIVLFAIWETN